MPKYVIDNDGNFEVKFESNGIPHNAVGFAPRDCVGNDGPILVQGEEEKPGWWKFYYDPAKLAAKRELERQARQAVEDKNKQLNERLKEIKGEIRGMYPVTMTNAIDALNKVILYLGIKDAME